MTIKELVELNFCIAEIEVEVRSNGRLKAKYYIGDGAWRDAKLREHEAHQDYKVEFIAEKIKILQRVKNGEGILLPPDLFLYISDQEFGIKGSICMADDKKTLASD